MLEKDLPHQMVRRSVGELPAAVQLAQKKGLRQRPRKRRSGRKLSRPTLGETISWMACFPQISFLSEAKELPASAVSYSVEQSSDLKCSAPTRLARCASVIGTGVPHTEVSAGQKKRVRSAEALQPSQCSTLQEWQYLSVPLLLQRVNP